MAHVEGDDRGPDLRAGISVDTLADGQSLLGHVGDEKVLLVRYGDAYFAVGTRCTHYGGPLEKGLIVGDTVRCPWHHACFSLRTGEALRAPAFRAIPSWETEVRDGRVVVTGRRRGEPPRRTPPETPGRIVIVGGGAAGYAAAERLRREGYEGQLVMLSDDDAPPVDRPNLSKDFLAGTAPEDWVPLAGPDFYHESRIDLRLRTRVEDVDAEAREVRLAGGERLPWDRLLLATGAEPVRLAIPGADQTNVLTLRSLADCHRIIEWAAKAERVLVMGASFIGLEVAAALRGRGLGVDVVAPDRQPMERVLGPQLGRFVRTLHEERGVVFHLEKVAERIDGREVTLSGGDRLEADFIVVGIGVRPRTVLAERAGLALDNGVLVDPFLQTSAPGIYAAGDIARWPDPHTGRHIRVEHWVVAERQGQHAALNMLGHERPFDLVPFFWSQHYDIPINYVGHAATWDELAIEGDVENRDALVRFLRDGRTLAAASIFRDRETLEIEAGMERALRQTTG